MEAHLKFSVDAREGGADPFSLVKEDIDRMESLLKDHVSSEAALILEVGRYIFSSGGKRFRPALHILACNMLGVSGMSRIWMAAALECLHTATLLHDDVVDGAAIRRGMPAANAVWGDHTAVLVGDFLFATSVQWILNTNHPDMPRRFAMVSQGMAEGEAYQLSIARTRRLNEEDYLHVVSMKTAGLISLACSSAAMLAGADKKIEDALATYGHSVGMAFQIVDDALDYCSEENELGKAIGKDLEEGKITLPMLHALEKADRKDRKVLDTILDSRPFQPNDLARAQEIIHRYGGIDYAKERASEEIASARNALSIFPQSPAHEALLQMADFTVSRSR